jgi:hypothetical protein
MLCGNGVPAVTYDHGGEMRSLPQIFLGMSRLATLLLSLGPAKLARRNLREISADWQYDPKLKTEVEVRFISEGKDGTRVELEHRHLDRYGRVATRCTASSTAAKAAGVACLRRSPAPLRLEKGAA